MAALFERQFVEGRRADPEHQKRPGRTNVVLGHGAQRRDAHLWLPILEQSSELEPEPVARRAFDVAERRNPHDRVPAAGGAGDRVSSLARIDAREHADQRQGELEVRLCEEQADLGFMAARCASEVLDGKLLDLRFGELGQSLEHDLDVTVVDVAKHGRQTPRVKLLIASNAERAFEQRAHRARAEHGSESRLPAARPPGRAPGGARAPLRARRVARWPRLVPASRARRALRAPAPSRRVEHLRVPLPRRLPRSKSRNARPPVPRPARTSSRAPEASSGPISILCASSGPRAWPRIASACTADSRSMRSGPLSAAISRRIRSAGTSEGARRSCQHSSS